MSLDITLINPTPIVKWSGTGVFVREGGHNKELSVAEVQERWPGSAPTNELYESNEVFTLNITHNLNEMAKQADLYQALWHPDAIGMVLAQDALGYLTNGFTALVTTPEHFKQYNPENGWGSYEQLVEAVRDYIIACVTYPDARIEVDK